MAIELGGVGASLGSALGQGISQPIQQGLDMLAQQKMMAMQQAVQQKQALAERQRYSSGLEPILGKEGANFIANLNPEERKYALQNFGSLQQLMGQQSQPGMQQQMPQAGEGMNVLMQGMPTQPGAEMQQGMPNMQEALSSPIQNIQQQERNNLVGELFQSPEMKIKKENLAVKKELAEIQKEAAQAKQTSNVLKYLQPYEEKYVAGKNNIRDYEMLANLARTGKLQTGQGRAITDKLGLTDIIGRNYTTELGDKLIARLAQNAGSAFGPNARITNFLEKTFQRSLPSVWNTPKAIVAISEMNKRTDMADNILPLQARQEIIEEHGGKIPVNIHSLVEKRIAPQIKQLEKESYDIMEQMVSGKSSKGSPVNKSYASFDETPAAQFKGKWAYDDETKEWSRSNGKEWIPGNPSAEIKRMHAGGGK